ncbi:MAG: tetratricopeptide repeat protein [Verrucomicrobiota bacterium]
MIRRRRLPSRLALAQGCLVLALLAAARARAEDAPAHPTLPATKPEAAATEHPAPESHAATPAPESSTPAAAAVEAPAPAAPASTPAAPKRARDEIQGLLNLGVSLTERGDYEAAEIAYRQVLNAQKVGDLELKSALLGLAHMHRRQGALTKAVAIYERFLKDYPGDDRTPDALLDLGRTLRGLGVHKSALARFYNVINSTLKLPGEGLDRYQVLAKTAQFEIAETYFQAGEYADANKFYTRLRLLDLAPADRARAHFKAGYSVRLQGDLEGAVSTLRAYIEQWPADENIPEARYLLAITLREMNRPQEAFAATLDLLRTEKSRIESDPKRWAYWQRRTGNQLANDFFETGDTMNARAIYAGLLELSPEQVWRLPISYQLALCHERLGALDQARKIYQKIVEDLGPTPQADYTELATMSKWRIEHLEWREKTGQQLDTFFGSTTGKQAAITPPPAAAAKTAATP